MTLYELTGNGKTAQKAQKDLDGNVKEMYGKLGDDSVQPVSATYSITFVAQKTAPASANPQFQSSGESFAAALEQGEKDGGEIFGHYKAGSHLIHQKYDLTSDQLKLVQKVPTAGPEELSSSSDLVDRILLIRH